MRSRLLSCFFLLFSVPLMAEPYFEVIDSEENSVVGAISALDRTQVVVDVEGELHTLPLEKLVKIRNMGSNPYGKIPASVFPNLLHQMPPTPASAKTAGRGANVRRVAASLEKEMRANEQSFRKTFPKNVIVLELVDGSQLTVSSFTAAKDQCVCRLLDQPNDLTFPLKTLSAVRFAVRSLAEVVNPPADWLRLAVPNTEGDRIVVGNPDAFDVYTGILQDITAETVSFVVEDEVLPVPLRKVFGLVFHGNSPVASEPPLGTLTLWTGTRGMISDTQLSANELSWQTSTGLSVTSPLEGVEEMDFGEKGIAYLTDFAFVRSEFSLPIESDIQQLPFLQTFFENRTKSSSRETILDGIGYGQSVTLRGKTSLDYSLPKPFASLKAVIGIEDQFRPNASATLRILANSQMLGTWELRGDSASERIQVNLPQNCRTITLIVEPQSGLPAVLTIADPKLLE